MARLTKNERRTLQQQAFPDRFQDAEAWIALARNALTKGAPRFHKPAALGALIGVAINPALPDIFASSAFDLRPAYEALRLEAKLLTQDARNAVNAARNSLARAVRQQIDPISTNGFKIGFWILAQAMLDPNRRRGFSRMIRDLDLEARAFTPRRR